MIPEIGHYTLILALFVAIVQATVPLIGAARDDRPWMEVASHGGSGSVPAGRHQLRGSDLVLCDFGLFGLQRLREQPYRQADAL